MSFVAVAIGGSAVIAGGIGYINANNQSNATRDAAQMQADAANNATLLQGSEYNHQVQIQQPYLDVADKALPQLSSMASQTPQFTQQDFLNNQDPAYQFDLQQGQQALERSAAARGGLQTGGTLKDLTNYAQGAASNEYQNAYTRFMNNQNTQFNRLASVAGLGQTSSGAIGAAGANMANNVGNIAMSNANAQGAATIANSQIWGNTLSSLGSGVGNAATQYAMMNKYAPQMPTTTPSLSYAAPSAGGGGGGGYSLGVDYSSLSAGI